MTSDGPIAPASGTQESFDQLLARLRACRICPDLPLGPRPVLRVHPDARVLIVGQAPGTKVHNSGLAWDDPSGDRLRSWLQVDKAVFYDEAQISHMPVGLCYPGKAGGGDRPPRPQCAPLWHPPVTARLGAIGVTVLIGSYAHAYYLGERRKPSMTETVAAWRDYWPRYVPTPHPSWHNNRWLKLNPWFEAELLPELRGRVRALLGL